MPSSAPKTLVGMTARMGQFRNTLNRELRAMRPGVAIETLAKAKACWVEASTASKEHRTARQISMAERSLRRLRSTIEQKLKQLGWGWDGVEERAKRVLKTSSETGVELVFRTKPEGGLVVGMGNLEL